MLVLKCAGFAGLLICLQPAAVVFLHELPCVLDIGRATHRQDVDVREQEAVHVPGAEILLRLSRDMHTHA